MSSVSVSGAVSGIDTASLIDSLVSVQQNQQTLLKTKQSTEQSAANALGTLITAMSSLATKAATVADTSSWNGSTATSSSSTVSAKTTATTSGTLNFDVTSVAKAHTLISAGSVSAMNAKVADGDLTITKADGSTVTVSTGTGTLSDVVSAINASSAGVKATAVQASSGQYRLQLTSSKTGEASSFSVSGLTGFTGMNVLTQGSDAQIKIGSDPTTAYTVNSSTNTFSGIVPGLSFTVSKVESDVTVNASVDGSGVASNIQSMVDSVNSVLSSIETSTAYNATTKTGGALVGDSTARSLQQTLLSMVSSTGAPGLSLTRDGRLTFDANAFETAYAADPTGTAAKFGATGTFASASGVAGAASYTAATSATRAGTYAVNITAAAATESWTADASGDLTGKTISLARGSTTASYTVKSGDSLSDIVTGLNKAAGDAGLTISASSSGTNLLFTATKAGASYAFTAAVDGTAATRAVAGADVQGTIDGQTATGTGSELSLTSGTGGAVGLTINTTFTAADVAATGGAVGSISYQPGIAQRLTQLVADQTATGTGILTAAKAGRESEVTSLQSEIDDWDTRLSNYRASLTSQFTAMETALASLKSQSSFLTSYSSTSSS